jgi:uroporphyrinogen-III decarboxylase
MIPVQHCCGKAESLIEDFIEEGAVAWTSVEPINDIEGLLQKYGSQITLIGGFRANGTAGQVSATEEERRQEVRDVFDQYAKYGSFIFGNFRLLIGSDDPNEAERIMGPILDEANKYGKYFYR